MTAVLGFGAKFYLHNGTALAEVTDVVSVNRPNLAVETIDTTNHGTTSGVRTFMRGLADPGELTVRIFYDPGSANDTLLLAALSASSRAFKIVIKESDGTTQDVTGTCIPTGYEPDDIVVDDKMTAVFTAKLTGATTQAASA